MVCVTASLFLVANRISCSIKLGMVKQQTTTTLHIYCIVDVRILQWTHSSESAPKEPTSKYYNSLNAIYTQKIYPIRKINKKGLKLQTPAWYMFKYTYIVKYFMTELHNGIRHKMNIHTSIQKILIYEIEFKKNMIIWHRFFQNETLDI